ncbi:MAG: stage II sporulation protein P, partial [Oscillospiraceae bacterium]|nr:stage II sporulation protein P [Oscillospiraceae bacterium]
MPMTGFGRFAVSILTTAGLLLLAAGGGAETLSRRWRESADQGRMKNVVLLAEAPPAQTAPAETPRREITAQTLSRTVLPPMEDPAEEAQLPDGDRAEQVLETTIQGGMRIKNETGYFVDAGSLLAEGPALRLPRDEAQILIIHTHASEAYTQAGLDRYTPSDLNRTEDTQFNIVRVGDELTELLTRAGLGVIHDRGIYDYPSYTGSYTRAGEAIEQYLESCPGIRIVLDIHRDALGSDGVVYKTMAEEEGTVASQIMLLVGTDASGLEHPGWRENLALALYLQNAVNTACPTLMRPIALVPQRYNQQLTPGSLIIEVGSSGNTLQEALAAIRLFGNAA